MLIGIGIGTEGKGKYYVQTFCNKEHNGCSCECKSLVENVSKRKAEKIAKKYSHQLNVPVEVWE